MGKFVRLDKWLARRNARIRVRKVASVSPNSIPGNPSAPPVNVSKNFKFFEENDPPKDFINEFNSIYLIPFFI